MAPPTPYTSSNNDMEDMMKRYMDELQQGRPAEAAPGQALDLRSSSADLDHGSHRSENDSDSWEKNISGGEDSSSEVRAILT